MRLDKSACPPLSICKAGRAAVHGVTKRWAQLSDWTKTIWSLVKLHRLTAQASTVQLSLQTITIKCKASQASYTFDQLATNLGVPIARFNNLLTQPTELREGIHSSSCTVAKEYNSQPVESRNEQERGPLPGPKTGLLYNTWKWTVWGDTWVDKARAFTGKGCPGREQEGEGTRRTVLSHASQSWILQRWDQFLGCLWPVVLTQSPSWWSIHCSAKMDTSEKDSGRR